MSDTYKQSSNIENKSHELDPLNKYYSHAPRVRLTAEQIRDQALVICGSLNNKMFGPSVMPFQPDGIWASPYDGRKWEQSKGDEIYRRAIYTYWKRTGPYPTQINFDGTAREVCTSRRIRTNTPLQALNLLNDSTYWDLSVKLAKKVLDEHPTSIDESIKRAYEAATGKDPDQQKIQVLKNLYWISIKKLKLDPRKSSQMISDSTLVKSNQLAAMSVTTSAILNLDEVITKN